MTNSLPSGSGPWDEFEDGTDTGDHEGTGDWSSAVSDPAHHVLGHSRQGVCETILDGNDDKDDHDDKSHMTSVQGVEDELVSTVLDAVRCLPINKQAAILLDTSLELIEAGQYGIQVEDFLEVYLKTPGLPQEDVMKALLARGAARRAAAERLMVKAQQDIQALSRLDPSNRQVKSLLQLNKQSYFRGETACHRTPLEIWDRVASYIPRYYLRTWLFVSAFHRDIAQRHIFSAVDLHLGEDQEHRNRALDFFDRVKEDSTFAKKIKRLRLHWSYEEGDMFDLVARIFRTALPEFTSLREFQWIGYPELRAEMVQEVFIHHQNIQSLGLIGWHFDAIGISSLNNLHSLTLRAEDDDGLADMDELLTTLNTNSSTLTHLCLSAYLARPHSWDSAFQSSAIDHLTRLELVDTKISHYVLRRIMTCSERLTHLTLHGTFEDPRSAEVLFGADHVLEGRHTFLPYLESFRFLVIDHDDDIPLYQTVVQFIGQRKKLRRLDLGRCPWELVAMVLPELDGLRAVRVRIGRVDESVIDTLTKALSEHLLALHLCAVVADKSVESYVSYFKKFRSLSILHLNTISIVTATVKRPQPNMLNEKEFRQETDRWMNAGRKVAATVPSVDFLGWYGEHYVVVRHDNSNSNSNSAQSHYTLHSTSHSHSHSHAHPPSHTHSSHSHGHPSSGQGSVGKRSQVADTDIELKELPPRRRLDTGFGVDLGGPDGCWLERIDVPIDYELVGGHDT
ncbi:hypothetical protein BDM02DRAFT_296674 [Thelephora ganbajun]|uniref:Uncharacterized protein n=1 Tax=Thelephora ganbajun TaxID=370292 RepID=A0ACB6ZA46_THEGA|nr:hypothetical protein BDM02DRAFT_296674 [Thelephora ganbajun]